MTWTEPAAPPGSSFPDAAVPSNRTITAGLPAVLDRADITQHRTQRIPNRMDPGLRLTPSPSRRAPRPATRIERIQRLPVQDEWLFETTVTELAKVDPLPRNMVEINAGISRALEVFMSSAGCRYSTVDSNCKAVARRIQSGASPARNQVGDPTNLSALRDFHFDLALSRMALAWQSNPDSRQLALAEQIRIGWRSLVINLDWSVADGGPAWRKLCEYATGALRTIGFDPYYGAVQHAEIRSQARVGARIETNRVEDFSSRFRGIVLASVRGVLLDHPIRLRVNIDDLLFEARAEMENDRGYTLPAIVATHCY